MTLEKTRDRALDMLKGFCIFLVVYGHLQRTGKLEPYLTEIAKAIYTFHMPIFVFVSGFLFANKLGRMDEVKKVLQRILKPYFVVGFMLVLAYWLLARISPRTFSAVDMSIIDSIGALITGHPGGAVWFLYTLAFVQLVGIAWFAISCKWQKWWLRDFGLMLLLIIMSHLLSVNHCRVTIPFWFAMYFGIGVCVHRYFDALPSFGWGCVIVVGLVFLVPIERDTVGNYPYVLSMIGFLLWIAKRGEGTFCGRILAYLGERSIALLLFHPFFLGAMKPVLRLLSTVDQTGLLGMSVTLFVAIVGCLMVDKIILTTRLKKVVY